MIIIRRLRNTKKTYTKQENKVQKQKKKEKKKKKESYDDEDEDSEGFDGIPTTKKRTARQQQG